ncbi:MAG: hypothetical protein NTX50_01175 [Candidatus Sumerlaeota bacterium]|nr:hypothetical protein [Candidatus Sumerlaeota bacterium]
MLMDKAIEKTSTLDTPIPFPQMPKDQMHNGSMDEDSGIRSLNHGYNPLTGTGFHSISFNARDTAADRYASMISAFDNGHYSGGDDVGAWHFLGRTSHLLQDMASPLHSMGIDHLGNCNYESYWRDNVTELTTVLGFSEGALHSGILDPQAMSKLDSFTRTRLQYRFDNSNPYKGAADVRGWIDTMAWITYFRCTYWGQTVMGSSDGTGKAVSAQTSAVDFSDGAVGAQTNVLYTMFNGNVNYIVGFTDNYFEATDRNGDTFRWMSWTDSDDWAACDWATDVIDGSKLVTGSGYDSSAAQTTGRFWLDTRETGEIHGGNCSPNNYPDGSAMTDHFIQYYGKMLIPLAVRYDAGLLCLANRRVTVKTADAGNTNGFSFSKADNFGNGASFTVSSSGANFFFAAKSQVNLTAPGVNAAGRPFVRWLKDGSVFSSNLTITFNSSDSWIPKEGAVYQAVYSAPAASPTPNPTPGPTPNPNTFSVRTQLITAAPLAGVLVDVTDAYGALISSSVIDTSGMATLSAPAIFNGFVTPYKTGYEFTPVNASVSFPNPSTSDIVFTAAVSSRLVHVSGTITVQGAGPLAGVTVTVAGAGVPTTHVLTIASGAYSIDLPINATNVILTPSLAGYTFAPPSAALPPLVTAQTQNFIATPAIISLAAISGQVRLPSNTAATTVVITVMDASSSSTIVTTSGIASGAAPFNYRVSVAPPFSGYVTASSNGWIFLPSRRAYDRIMSSHIAQDFDGQILSISALALTDVYSIIYKKDGRGTQAPLDGASGIVVSSGSITITGSSDRDTLSIRIRSSVKQDPVRMAALPGIQLVQTGAGFASFLSEARIDHLKAKGALSKLTTTNASIGKIETEGSLGTIAMADNKQTAEVITAIYAKSARSRPASLKLMGVKLEVLVTPNNQPFKLVEMDAKKYKLAGARPAEFYVSKSGFIGGSGATYDLQTGTVSSLLTYGAILGPNTIVGNVKNIKCTAQGLNSVLYPAHISIGYLHATQDISISAAGGDIEPGLYLADGKVITFNTSRKSFRNTDSAGGYIGHRPLPGDSPTTYVATTTNALTAVNTVVVCSGLRLVSSSSMARDIRGIYGQTGVYGLFVAGGKATLNSAGDIVSVVPQLDTLGGKVVLIKTSPTGAGVARIYGDVANTKIQPRTNANFKVYENNSLTPRP